MQLEMLSESKRVLNAPTESDFLTLCSSFTQYTGKKIKIKFLERPVDGNKFIEVIYDEYIIKFSNADEMAYRMSGIMYADLKDKIQS